MSDTRPMIAVDSGIEGGYAWFPKGSKLPLLCGTFKPETEDEQLSFQMRTRRLVQHLLMIEIKDAIAPFRPELIVCEYPVVFKGSGSMVAESSGSLIKLAYWVGHLAGVSSLWWPEAEFLPVEPNKWKGNLSKLIVEQRLRRKLGEQLWARLNPTSHAVDAIGIGMWQRGNF